MRTRLRTILPLAALLFSGSSATNLAQAAPGQATGAPRPRLVALFLTGPAERTLPRQMFVGIRENISPVIAAAATLLILLSVLLMATTEILRRRSARLHGRE